MPDFKLDDPDFNIDDLDNLSAEELEKLEQQDNGDTELSPDDQNFSISGIDELNNFDEPGDETPPNVEDPEDTTGNIEPEVPPAPEEVPPVAEPETPPTPAEPAIDYQAKYNATMEILANQKLLDDSTPAPSGEPATPTDTRTAYERAMGSVNLDTIEQARYDELAEFDEDAANDFKERAKEKQIFAAMLEKQESDEADKVKIAADTHKTEQQLFTDAINASDNLKKWQQDQDTWGDVQGMHNRLLRDPSYANANTPDKMKKLEQRFAKFSGVESDNKPVAISEETPPIDNSTAQRKIAEIENKVNPPSSLSSVSGGQGDNKPGRIKLDNSSDAADIQILMDRAAESDDPEAIDKLLASVDFG